MSAGRASTIAGYASVAKTIAQQALSLATDTAPHRAREGERRWSMAGAMPAARLLVDQASDEDRASLAVAAQHLAQTLSEESGKVTDGFGHARPSYDLFAIHLLGTAARFAKQQDTLETVKHAATTILTKKSTDDAPSDPRLAVWRRLIARQHGLNEAEELSLPSTDSAPLVPLGLNDLIDSWTYYELVGLHGLHLSNLIEPDDAMAGRVRSAADYHLGHTQPDYTTYQPWALAAFASDPHTAVFAEQQLHDVATHLSIEGPGGAVMPALLLADSAAAMSGTLTQVWRG